MIGFIIATKAQTRSSVTTSACANLIVPVSMTAQNAINFGITSKKIGVGGSVILSTKNAAIVYKGGVSGTAGEIAVSNAVFNITGASNHSFSLTLPTTITVENLDKGEMIIDKVKICFNNSSCDIAINNNSIANMLNTRGTNTFRLGARLNVKPNQSPGTYTGTYNVIVDYN